MATDQFVLKGGKWAFPKNPPDEAWFGVDVSDLLGIGVSIASDPAPTATAVGVKMLQPTVRLQGNFLLAFLGGMDVSDAATIDSNVCTFSFYLSSGEHFYRSIHFFRKDK